MATLTPELKRNINDDPNSGLSVQEDQGIVVLRVVPESPAAKAGLRAGDVITKIDGQAVTTSEQLQQTVENGRIGTDLQLELRRNGEPLNLTVKPGAFPTQSEQ